MPYDIFNLIPHQRVVNNENNHEEIFDLYQCGIFKNDSFEENIELVELQANAKYRAHYHQQSSAVIYIIAGIGVMRLAKEQIEYKPGMRIDIPAGVIHGFKTESRTLFLSLQSPPIINPENREIDLHYADGE